MDWGYESETGQVWLFNVTPFTPHLPHWRNAFVCVPSYCHVKLCFLCECACVQAHMHILCWLIFLLLTCKLNVTNRSCSGMFMPFNMNFQH